MKVSVCIMTYNHEQYIAQALDGVLMQKTDFDYEILVGEDQSTDSTRDIVLQYKEKNPQIKLFLHEYPANYVRINGRKNLLHNLALATGEYIAILDGDDYWTDPYKLQKQVDFLEQHPDYSTVFHWADWIDNGKITPGVYGPPVVKDCYTTDDLLERSNFIPTCTALFRRAIVDELPDWIAITPYADLPLHILNSLHGKIGFMDESMAAYRLHHGGLYSGRSRIYQVLNNFICFEIMSFHLNFSDNQYYKNYIQFNAKELDELLYDDAILIEAIRTIKKMSDRYCGYPSVVAKLIQIMMAGVERNIYSENSLLTITDAIAEFITLNKIDVALQFVAEIIAKQNIIYVQRYDTFLLTGMTNGEISISVVMCTYNRADLLEASIRSVEQQVFPKSNFEIIVVDNNSTDGTKEIVANLVRSSSVPLRYIFEPEQGLSHARNTGIRNAHGEIVVFVDDDVEVAENWLAELVVEFLNPNVVCVGGPVRPIWLAERPEWLTDQWTGWLTLHEYEWAKETRELTGPCYPVGANIAFRRDVFDKVGYFSSELGRVGNCLLSNEESRLCTAIEEAGLKIRLAPEAIVYHKIPAERLNKQFFFKRMYWQGISDAIMDGIVKRKTFSIARNLAKAAARVAKSEHDSFSQLCHYKYFAGYVKGLLDHADKKSYYWVIVKALRSLPHNVPPPVVESAEPVNNDHSARLAAAELEIQQIRNSLSWRLTAPLRFIGNILRNR